MTRHLLTLLIVPLSLAMAGCVAASDPVPPPTENACGAAGLQGLIGQPASVLASMTLLQPVRVISPGQAVTMDFRAERLNIELNAAQVITRVNCG